MYRELSVECNSADIDAELGIRTKIDVEVQVEMETAGLVVINDGNPNAEVKTQNLNSSTKSIKSIPSQ